MPYFDSSVVLRTRLIPVKKNIMPIIPTTVNTVNPALWFTMPIPVYINPIIPSMVKMAPKVRFKFMLIECV